LRSIEENPEFNQMDNARLQNRIAGRIIDRNHPEYQGVWKQNWNQLRPERYPDLIVQVSSDHDVVEAVKYARENRLKVAVRGGGHAWCATPLRKGIIHLTQGTFPCRLFLWRTESGFLLGLARLF
jgi:hypothetical protein